MRIYLHLVSLKLLAWIVGGRFGGLSVGVEESCCRGV